MQLEITIKGQTEAIDFDLGLEALQLSEAVRLEDALPPETFAALMEADDGSGFTPTPRVLQAIIWAKLATSHPEIGLNDFDLDISEVADLVAEQAADAAPVVIPMTIEGETVEAEVLREGKG